METTPKQIAEQAWKNRLENLSKNGLAQVEGGNLSLWNVPDNSEEREYWKHTFKSGAELGIFDYKQALREAIENRKRFIEECIPPYNHYDARKKGGLHEIEKILQLIETVTPSKDK